MCESIGKERAAHMKDIAVTYLGGSGFLVGMSDVGLLFDASEHGQDMRSLR